MCFRAPLWENLAKTFTCRCCEGRQGSSSQSQKKLLKLEKRQQDEHARDMLSMEVERSFYNLMLDLFPLTSRQNLVIAKPHLISSTQ